MKKLLFLFTALAIVSAYIPKGIFLLLVSAAASHTVRDMTTMEIVYEMGIGINLGNTLDATGNWFEKTQKNYETCWGSPIITEAMIAKLAEGGFRSLRIPVTWSNMLAPAPDYTVHADLLDRVQQFVDWTIKHGMYAVVNMHHDGFIGELFPKDEEEGFKKYSAIWKQVSERFKDYGDYLILESMNEPGFDAIWNQYGGTQEQKIRAFDLLNRINQRFVDIVRGSGGNNAQRHLLIAAYYTNIDHATNGLTKMPNDPAERLAISVHYYGPPLFVMVATGHDPGWGGGRGKAAWGTAEDFAELNNEFDKMKIHYTDKGIPVIIGEYAMCSSKEKQYSDLWTIEVTKAIFERGMCPMLWDVQLTDLELLQANAFYDRRTLSFVNPEVLKAFQNISAARRYSDSDDEWILVSVPVETAEYHFDIRGAKENKYYFEYMTNSWNTDRRYIDNPANGKHSITYEFPDGGETGMKNLGYIHKADGSDPAPVLFELDKIDVNGNELLPARPFSWGRSEGGEGLPHIWYKPSIMDDVTLDYLVALENADKSSWMIYDSATESICYYENGLKTNITSLTYHFTISNSTQIAETFLDFTVKSSNPDTEYLLPFKAANDEAYIINVDFGEKTEGFRDIGFIGSINGTDITLTLTKIVINGEYTLLSSAEYIMETKPGGNNGLPNISDTAEGEKLFVSMDKNTWLAKDGEAIKLLHFKVDGVEKPEELTVAEPADADLTEAEPLAAEPEENTASATPEPVRPEPVETAVEEEPKKEGQNAVWIAFSIAAVVLLGGSVFIFMKKRKK